MNDNLPNLSRLRFHRLSNIFLCLNALQLISDKLKPHITAMTENENKRELLNRRKLDEGSPKPGRKDEKNDRAEPLRVRKTAERGDDFVCTYRRHHGVGTGERYMMTQISQR